MAGKIKPTVPASCKLWRPRGSTRPVYVCALQCAGARICVQAQEARGQLRRHLSGTSYSVFWGRASHWSRTHHVGSLPGLGDPDICLFPPPPALRFQAHTTILNIFPRFWRANRSSFLHKCFTHWAISLASLEEAGFELTLCSKKA